MNILTSFFAILSHKVVVLAIIYTLVLLFIFLDLWSGIRKAKAKKEFISSFGFRRTISKIARYFNMLFAVTIIDVIVMLAIFEAKLSIPIVPFFTFAAAFFIGIIEIKSIYEKAEQKDKAKVAEAAKIITQVLKDADNKEAILNFLDTIKCPEKSNN